MNECAARPRRSSLAPSLGLTLVADRRVRRHPRSPSLARVEFPRFQSTSTERCIHQFINSSIHRASRWMHRSRVRGGTPWGVTHPRLRPIERTHDRCERRTDGAYIKPRITRSGTPSVEARARAPHRARERPGGATHLDDDDGVDDDDDGDDATVEIDARDD